MFKRQDYREIIDGSDAIAEMVTDGVEKEKKDGDDKEQYEEICYICHRPEHIAGKMFKIPNNIFICQDCMQRTFDSMNNAPFSMDDMMNLNMGKMPNIGMINLSDFGGFGVPNNQKVKKKASKEKQEPVIDIHKIPAPHHIKASLDEYVVGQEYAKKVMLSLIHISEPTRP